MTFFEKSLETIELPAVMNMLAAEAVGAAAKEAVLAIAPSSDIYEVTRRQAETTAAKRMMETKGSPGFGGVSDIRGSVRRADMGGMLNTVELLGIAGVLRNADSAASYGLGGDEPTPLDGLFAALHANRYLENRITTSITGPDEIADAASSELADIRRHMRIAGDKVRQSLNKIITSPVSVKYLQEPIITMRNDRYVVPVRAEFKASVPGLVHDISSSGATLFIEPMSAVQANNEIRELLAKERAEIDRILMELSAEVASCGEEIICDFNVLTELDVVFAKAKLSYRMNAGEPELSQSGEISLRAARHPLLPAGTTVPIDVRLGGEYDTLVITGPNTGGKTVTLKTIGLLCAMAQCGLHIPAGDGSRVTLPHAILADIGDEQSIEQSLSTFSSHMTNIVRMLEECREGDLLLFDELGAGTDPVEGAALAIAIIENARGKGAIIAATTHYAELKVYATTSAGVQNASCEFDVETLRPTYKLLIGIPGKSNAFAISSRLGLPDDIISDAKSRIDAESASFEEVLENLEHTRQRLEKEELSTKKLLFDAEQDRKAAEQYRREVEKEKESAAKLARREADRIIAEARRAASEVYDELAQIRKTAAKDMDWQRVNDSRAAMHRKLNEAETELGANTEEEVPPPSPRPIRAGDTVRLLKLGTEAQVISAGEDGTLSLQAGIMKITVKEDEVRLVEKSSGPKTPKLSVGSSGGLRASSAKPELDIRGMMTDEAIPVVEQFLDGARMGKLTTVTIIHGKGTGALRKAVQTYLKSSPYVKTFRPGRFGEGEMGVTVVELR
ncbi:MAG: endonuclease MutS2 [Oscillospiraceae bacterium]|nr:endonuclease MutS2 [Oscillospiraceae bacterium]